MKRFALAIAGALLSAAYWWIVVTFVFGLFGGSYAPDAPPPSATAQTMWSGAIFLIAVLLYAWLSLGWQRLVGRPDDRVGD